MWVERWCPICFHNWNTKLLVWLSSDVISIVSFYHSNIYQYLRSCFISNETHTQALLQCIYIPCNPHPSSATMRTFRATHTQALLQCVHSVRCLELYSLYFTKRTYELHTMQEMCVNNCAIIRNTSTILCSVLNIDRWWFFLSEYYLQYVLFNSWLTEHAV